MLENEIALEIYYDVATQFNYDFHCTAEILAGWGYWPGMKKTRELLQKLALIHAVKSKKEEEKS